MAEQWECPCQDCQRARKQQKQTAVKTINLLKQEQERYQKQATNHYRCPICSGPAHPQSAGNSTVVYAWCPQCGLVRDPLVATGRD